MSGRRTLYKAEQRPRGFGSLDKLPAAEKAAAEAIAAAAVRRRGQVFQGTWHGDAREKMAAALGLGEDEVFKGVQSGYVTTRGRFVTEREALQIALACRQVTPADIDARVGRDALPADRERLETGVLECAAERQRKRRRQ